MLGLPRGITACLFDLDGVLTDTAGLHSAAWKEVFDDLLRELAATGGPPFAPFDAARDYAEHVDGKPRADGVRDFLASRGVALPEGDPDDPAWARTVHGMGTRKNALVQARAAQKGVRPLPGAAAYLAAARTAGLHRAVVSSSASAAAVLRAAGLDADVELCADATWQARRGLRGKPAPDAFLAAAADLGAGPAASAVFEDAEAGVRAGRAGGFRWVVGVGRGERAAVLRERGADVVVTDLGELLPAGSPPPPAAGRDPGARSAGAPRSPVPGGRCAPAPPAAGATSPRR